jgi:hypothetical protein
MLRSSASTITGVVPGRLPLGHRIDEVFVKGGDDCVANPLRIASPLR